MGYFHFEDEDNANAKMPAASKPDAERSKDNWAYNQLLLNAGVTSPVQTLYQLEVIEFPRTQAMALLSKMQYDRLSPEEQKLRENVNSGRPNVVFDLASALSRGITMDAIVNMTLEELVNREVTLLAVNFSLGALKEVVGGAKTTFETITKRDVVGTKPTIHRKCMIVFFTEKIDLLLGLDIDENAEARLAILRTNANDKALGNVFLSVTDSTSKRCLAKFHSSNDAATGTGICQRTLQDNASRNTLDTLGKKYGLSFQRLEDRSEYEALVTIENGTEEMKRIMAKNMKVSPKTNPELKKKLEDHFAKYGEQAKDQKAFMNGIEKEYKYSVRYQQDLFRDWAKKTKGVKKNTGDIKSFFTSTSK